MNHKGKQIVKLYITHSKRKTAEHFEALGFEDDHPNMVIRFDYTPQSGWHKWRHGGWLALDRDDVPPEVMAKYMASKPP